MKLQDRILFEDNHILIVNKLSGEIVQGDKTGDRTLAEDVKSYIKEKYNKPGEVFLGVVHRIDRPVSGAVIFSKTSKALSRLNEALKNKAIQKYYWAIVKEKPNSDKGRLEHYLVRNQEKNKSFVYTKEKAGSKLAVLSYELIYGSSNYYLLEVKLETGRHHQIRAQLAKIGCPIKGDLKYGFSRSNKDASISLHARKINFTHPVSKEQLTIECPVPNDPLWQFFENQAKN